MVIYICSETKAAKFAATLYARENLLKHIFILNPAAGNKKAEIQILPRILRAVKETGVEYEIHRTVNVGDGERYVRERCSQHQAEGAEKTPLRFYAVGGDGTLSEVANGAHGFADVEITTIPAGSGNDFVRIFEKPKDFLDIQKQLNGTAKPIDLLKCGNRYSINMINIGIDCAVVAKASEFKEMPITKGPLAYVAGVVSVFVKNQGIELRLRIGDDPEIRDEFTLLAIGNGRFCGGGFMGVPKAHIDDGLLDVTLVNKVPRTTFLALVGQYRKGTHVDDPATSKILTYLQCKRITIIPTAGKMDLCVDGEIFPGGDTEVSVEPGAILFSVPASGE